MLDDTEQDELVNFVLADPARLEIAVACYAAFDLIRTRIIKEFIESIAKHLRQTLRSDDGWIIDASALLEQPLEKEQPFLIRKSQWKDGARVEMNSNANGPRGWWLGVAITPDPVEFNRIKVEMAHKLGEARAETSEFPWLKYFDGRYADWQLNDWQQQQAVLELAEPGGGRYGSYISEELRAIAVAASDLLSEN